MPQKPLLAILLVTLAVSSACTGETPVKESTAPAAAAPARPASELRTMTARFAPADIKADIGALPENERNALAKLVDAARVMDGLFLKQVWAGNDALLETLARRAVADSSGAAGDVLHYFLINKGPWSRLDHHKSFVPGVPAKPESANFYPAGASKEEIQKWIDSLTGPAKASATGFFTTIRRGPDGHFVSVPYSIE